MRVRPCECANFWVCAFVRALAPVGEWARSRLWGCGRARASGGVGRARSGEGMFCTLYSIVFIVFIVFLLNFYSIFNYSVGPCVAVESIHFLLLTIPCHVYSFVSL